MSAPEERDQFGALETAARVGAVLDRQAIAHQRALVERAEQQRKALSATMDELDALAGQRDTLQVDAAPERVETLPDFFAACGAQVEYLVKPFVIRGGFVLVLAAPKVGKTFFSAWLAVAAVSESRRVLFVEEEGPREVMRDRLAPFLSGDPEAYRDSLFIAHRRGFRLDDAGQVDALIRDARERQVELIVLDPFVALHAGDENEQSHMNRACTAIQRIMREASCAVVLIHHTRKGESWSASSTAEATSADARGSGVLIGAVDSVISLKRLPAKLRKPGELRIVVENPDTRAGEPFAKRIAVIRMGQGGTPGSLSWEEPGQHVDAEGIEGLLARAVEKLKPAPEGISQQALRTLLQCNLGRLADALELGRQRGWIVQCASGSALSDNPIRNHENSAPVAVTPASLNVTSALSYGEAELRLRDTRTAPNRSPSEVAS